MKKLIDNFNRIHTYLRLSLTDKCNLNCVYCNPDNSNYIKLLRRNILTFDEILRLLKIFGNAGIKKIRFTGGEPLARKDVFDLFLRTKELKDKFNFDFGITTNGVLLEGNVHKLKNSGIEKLNISLDSLQADKFFQITKQDKFQSVMNSIFEAKQLGFNSLKVNAVIMKGINDDEVTDFVNFAVQNNLNVRFIEFMPFGNNDWNSDSFISWQELKSRIENKYELIPAAADPNGVAKEFDIKNHPGRVSFISSISDHFCATCNRLRISASGKLKLCLFTDGTNELDFKYLLNNDSLTDEDILNLVSDKLKLKREKHPPVEELMTYEKNQMLSIGG